MLTIQALHFECKHFAGANGDNYTMPNTKRATTNRAAKRAQ